MRLDELYFTSYYFGISTNKKETPIFKDPSLTELTKLLQNNDVRGFLWKSHLYIWDAHTLHVEVLKKFREEEDPSINYEKATTIIFFKDPYRFGRGHTQKASEFKFKNKALERLMSYFPDGRIKKTGHMNDILIWIRPGEEK